MLGRQGADQLGAEVARGIRRAVKAENPEAYLLGENFFDATSQLQGDAWDASMNYAGFTKPLWYWLRGFSVGQHGEPRPVVAPGRWPTAALADAWAALPGPIPWAIARQQFNLVDSHDTPRIKSIVGGDARLHRLAAGVLLTYLGVPCIYYGDEIGLGGDETDTRALHAVESGDVGQRPARVLPHADPAAAHLAALIEGGLQVLAVEEDTLAYLRDTEDEQIVVVAHRGPGIRPASPLRVSHGGIPDGQEFVEVIGGQRVTVSGGHLPLPAMLPGVHLATLNASVSSQ